MKIYHEHNRVCVCAEIFVYFLQLSEVFAQYR